MVVAPVALAHRRAAELAAPEDEGVLEQPATLEVADQRRRGLVDLTRAQLDVALDPAVVIPGPVVELHEAHAALEQSPREQAVGGVGAIRALGPVELEHVLRLVREVYELGHRGLHAEGQLVLGDARAQDRIDVSREPVELAHGVHDLALRGAVDTLGVVEVMHRRALRLEVHALVPARQEAGAPLPRRDRLRLTAASAGGQHHIAGQVVRHPPQAVGQPRAHARSAGQAGARVHQGVGWVVVDLLTVEGVDDADLVRDAPEVRELLADELAGLPEAPEVVLGTEADQPLPLQLRDLLTLGVRLGHRLTVHLAQLRLPVERLEVRGSARHAQVHDALDPRASVARTDNATLLVSDPTRRQQRREGRRGDAAGAVTKKATAGQAREVLVRVHRRVIASPRLRSTRATPVQEATSIAPSPDAWTRPLRRIAAAASGSSW